MASSSLVRDLAQHVNVLLFNTEELCYLPWAGWGRGGGGGGGGFSLADKYSNQMSVPLWDPRAQIHSILGSSLIQKKVLCGLC